MQASNHLVQEVLLMLTYYLPTMSANPSPSDPTSTTVKAQLMTKHSLPV